MAGYFMLGQVVSLRQFMSC